MLRLTAAWTTRRALCKLALKAMKSPEPMPLKTRPRTYRLLAIIALTLSIFPLTAPFGLIAGIVSRVLSRKRPEQFGGKRLATAAIIIGAFWIIAIPSGIYYGMVQMRRQFYTNQNCFTHARSLTTSLRIISIANNGAYASADSWCDAISKEVTSKDHFKCPDDPEHVEVGFAYNEKLSGVKDPNPRTVMIFEANLGWNGSGGLSNVIAKARHNGWAPRIPGTNAPSKRSNFGRTQFVVVGFADGRVQPVAVEDLKLLQWEP
jgi:hypothetical protein